MVTAVKKHNAATTHANGLAEKVAPDDASDPKVRVVWVLVDVVAVVVLVVVTVVVVTGRKAPSHL